MPAAAIPLPVRRKDLRIEPFGPDGDHVVKDPRSGNFFLLGAREHFLLLRLDGGADAEGVRREYERRFREPLDGEGLEAFVATAREQGMLVSETVPPPPRMRQSVLAWRKSLFDPDRLLAALAPRLRFVFTRGFLLLSGAWVLFAAFVLWANREEAAASARDAMRWESVALGWIVLAAVGILHELAHGLACKRHGGEVREVGVLFLFFMPCFYCNVSDAWLFREKSKRLWVMLAGGYCDLLVWAFAVLLWRVAEPGTLVHRVSFLVLGLSGVDSLFNFNPLLKLDGYYLLSDWQEVPNLRQRSIERAGAHVRRMLWGAPPPEPEPRGRFLTAFGLLSWAFSAGILAVTLFVAADFLHGFAGAAGYAAAAALVLPPLLGLFRGVCGGEVGEMIMKRPKRTIFWLAAVGGVASALCLVRVEEYSGGTFTVRPSLRSEIRGPAAGFLRTPRVDEGDLVSAGDVVTRIEVPDLECRFAQKRAELEEARAHLRLLEIGTRPEAIAEQAGRVERAERWHGKAREDLERMREALAEELAALDGRVAEAELQREASEGDYARIEALANAKVATAEELEKADRARRVASARVALAAAERRARETRGTIVAEDEMARREKELGDERAQLTLLEAGPRPEELAAQQARIDRLEVEIRHLGELRARLEIRSPVAGIVVTPRLKERAGEYVREGDLVCVVEERAGQVAEIALPEEKLRGVAPGNVVRFKARALPFETLRGRVAGIAPCAENGASGSRATVVVRCSMEGALPLLRSSMSGYARIHTGRRPLGAILLDRAMLLLRTEFWW